MNFFEHQDRARKRTGLLLVYFFIAVTLTVVAVNAAFLLLSGFLGNRDLSLGGWFATRWSTWVTLATLGVIGTGSLVRYLQLRQGGHVLADMVGARRLDPSSTEPRERMLLNIVEEMAIASGTPAPTTYVMDDEPGINAFVAGFQPTEAVLVVTRGALETFTRDEMQGVVGHEFSHLLNGDMRLNVQLYAILSGILLIGRIGHFLLRSQRLGRRSGGRGGVGIVLMAGLALFVVGYVGLFFGRLIKAAISRQREFLADASSVQFTRNPEGIASALATIGDHAGGSELATPAAEDMSHMCIAVPLHLSSLLATHPPLDERIRAIDPAFPARFRARKRKAAAETPAVVPLAEPAVPAAPLPPALAVSPLAGGNPAIPVPFVLPSGGLSATVGTLTPERLERGGKLHGGIPDPVLELLRTPDGARLVIYGLVIGGTPRAFEADCLRIVSEQDDPALGERLGARLPELRRLGPPLRLPCLDIALPALRALEPARKEVFLAVLALLVAVDDRQTLPEYLLLTLMRRHLAADAGKVTRVRHRAYRHVAEPLNVVFALLCRVGCAGDAEREALQRRLLTSFGIPAHEPLVSPATVTTRRLDDALRELAALAPLLKRPFIDACVDSVKHDGRIQLVEVELVRAIAEMLDCPVPPLAPSA